MNNKNKYTIFEDYSVVHIPYTGKNLPQGIYDCYMDLDTLNTLLYVEDKTLHIHIKSSGKPYAAYWNMGKRCYLHHLVIPSVKDRTIDHRNRNTLDNRRHNLRVATHSINIRNRANSVLSASGYKWAYADGNKWCARVQHKSKMNNLGWYDTPIEASRVANSWVLTNLGSEFCYRVPITAEL